MRRHAHVALRRGDERARVVLDEPFAPEIAKKRPCRSELARCRCARLAPAMQFGKKAADGGAIEIDWVEIAAPDAGLARDVSDQLREIALVRAYRVRRRVPVQRKESEKGLQMAGDHA